MIAAGTIFLLDSNVLINAHRHYYAFDLCPGFWSSVLDHHGSQRVFSTQRVKSELLNGGDRLAQWISNDLPGEFFIDDTTEEIATQYGPMMEWVMTGGFLPAATAKFATDADGWLVATAKQGNYCLVTHEARQAQARARVPMPNVCDEFRVSYCNTFEMLRHLGCSYS